MHYEMLLLGGTVRVAPYATFGSPELAASVLDALEGRTAALMANHGAVAYGADVAGALRATELLEWACTVYWRAAAVGEPRVLTEEDRAGRRRLRDAHAVRVDAGGLGRMKAIAMGVHVLDVLVRPVEAIPEGQGGQLVEEIRMTAAGSAGGFALVLAQARRRRCRSRGRGRVRPGRRHAAARCSSATASTPRCCCAATTCRPPPPCCPIRPDGSRPGVPRRRRERDLRPRRRAVGRDRGAPTHLHLGGPEFMGGEAAAKILSFARSKGVTTSADVLAPGDQGIVEWIAPALEHLDCFLPERRAGHRLHRARTTSRPRAARWSSAAPAAWRRRAAPTACCSSTATAPSACPPSPSTSSTRRAAATRSPPGSCAGSGSGARRTEAAVLGCATAAPRRAGARDRLSGRSTSRRSTRSPRGDPRTLPGEARARALVRGAARA